MLIPWSGTSTTTGAEVKVLLGGSPGLSKGSLFLSLAGVGQNIFYNTLPFRPDIL